MKILITSFGTRGDIQPFLALGQGLKRAGYQVGLCSSEGYRSDIEAQGLDYLHMDNELLELSKQLLSAGVGLRETFGIMKKMPIAVRNSMDDEWRAAEAYQPDLIIYHPKCLGTYHVAEKLGIPAIMSIPLPFYTPTTAFPVPFLAGDKGAWFNRMSYKFFSLADAAYSASVNDFRTKTLGMPKIKTFSNLLMRSDGSPVPIVYPISPSVLPRPEDYPNHVHLTGYWFLEQAQDYQAPPELLDFLEAGDAPIYIGFGSVSGRNSEKRTKIILDALQDLNQRAVFVSGWGKLNHTDFPKNVFAIDSVPHDWLFPKMSAIVHHGGAGTTAAGLGAGKPNLICHFLGDQAFWGHLVYQQGFGPVPIGQNWIRKENFKAAIQTMLHDSTMRQKAAAIGEKICQEDGIKEAVRVIQGILKTY